MTLQSATKPRGFMDRIHLLPRRLQTIPWPHISWPPSHFRVPQTQGRGMTYMTTSGNHPMKRAIVSKSHRLKACPLERNFSSAFCVMLFQLLRLLVPDAVTRFLLCHELAMNLQQTTPGETWGKSRPHTYHSIPPV